MSLTSAPTRARTVSTCSILVSTTCVGSNSLSPGCLTARAFTYALDSSNLHKLKRLPASLSRLILLEQETSDRARRYGGPDLRLNYSAPCTRTNRLLTDGGASITHRSNRYIPGVIQLKLSHWKKKSLELSYLFHERGKQHRKAQPPKRTIQPRSTKRELHLTSGPQKRRLGFLPPLELLDLLLQSIRAQSFLAGRFANLLPVDKVTSRMTHSASEQFTSVNSGETTSSLSNSPGSFHSARSIDSAQEPGAQRSRESSGSFQSVSNVLSSSTTSSTLSPPASSFRFATGNRVSSVPVPRITVRVQRKTSGPPSLPPASAEVKQHSKSKTEQSFKEINMPAMDNHNTSSSESPKSPQTSNDVSTVDGATEAKKRELSKSPSASSRSPQRSYDSPIEHQRTSAASNAVKAAAKAAAASVQSFDAGSGGSASSGDRKEGIVIGRKDAVELLQSNVFTQSPPPSATLSSSEHNQPGAGESINRTMDGAKKAEDDKGPGSNAAQHPAGEQKEGTASGYALLGRSLDTGATMVPPHLLWRQGAEGEFSSNAPTREGVTKSHGSAWSSMAAASGIGEHDAVRSREQSGRSVASVLSAASLGSPPSQGHGLLGAEFRTGDWVCVSDTCSFHNFAQNLTCLGCGAAKPVGTCGDNPPQRNQQQGARDHSKNDAGSPLSSSSISASTATAGSSGLGPANSSGLTTKQIQELMAQHRVKTETGSKHQQNLSASSAATSAAGVAASQWAPGGTLSSATENNTATSQQGGRGNGSYFTSQAGAAPTGGSGIRYGGTNNYGAYGSYTGGTSTPPSQANMAALEAFRASAGTPGLGMNPYQQNPLAQYLPIQAQIQAQAHAQAQAQAQQGQGQGQGQRGGSAYGGMAPNMSLYQLQLQHAAMKNQNGMPLAQSSGPLARMQALTSAFGGMPSANQNQSQGSMPAYGQSYTNMNAGSSAGGPIRYGQQSQHSAHSSLSATTASFNHNGLSSHLPISTSSTPSYGAQVSSGYPMQHFTGSSQGQNQSQGQAQLPPLDWSNFGKSSANVPYPTAAPYRSAHMQNQSTLNTSLPSSTPAMSSTTSMSTSVSTAYNDSASASVGVGLNLPGGVEGLAIKQPWLSTAPSNAATAARLANLGIGIGPGVNPNVGGPDPVSEKRKATAGNNEDASADGGSSNPPIVNTGNSGPMCVQPGDWVCSGCGFVNWRRRRVCLRCFPFAEGNETAASLANGAILAAQLAAGVSPSKVDTASLLKSPSRGRETRSREQSAPGATGYEYQSGQMATTPIVGLGLNLGPSNQQGFGSPMPRYPGTAGTPAFGANALAPLPTSSSQPTLLLNPFDSAPPTRRTSPKESPALANPVPNWASASHADRMGMDSRISPPAGFAQDWQRRAAGGGPGAGRTVSGPVLPTTRAPGGPTTASMHSITSHMRQTSFNSAPSVPESEILGSGSTSSSAWYASPVGSGAAIFTPSTTRTNSGSSTTMSAGAGQGSTAGAGAAASAGMSASTRNIWGTSPPRKIGANKLVDEDNREVGNGAVRGSIGAVSRPVGFRNSGSSSVDSYDHGSHGNNNATSPT